MKEGVKGIEEPCKHKKNRAFLCLRGCGVKSSKVVLVDELIFNHDIHVPIGGLIGWG